MRGVKTDHRALLDSKEFHQLLARRWRMSLLLTFLLFVLYYGYIIVIAINRPFVSRRIGQTMTLGIPLGAAVILWANRRYDVEAARLRDRLHHS